MRAGQVDTDKGKRMEASPYDADAFNTLAAQLMAEDEDQRYEAANQIQRMGQPVIASIIEWTHSEYPRMREMACYCLGQIGHWLTGNYESASQFPEATPILVYMLESDMDAEVRAGAAFALGHQGDTAAIPALIRAAHQSEEARYGVAHALGSFYESTWEEQGAKYKSEAETALLQLMDDKDDDVRDWATFGIHQGGHNTTASRAQLWKALDDTNPDVRGEAAEGLAKFDDRAFIPRLAQLLREDEPMSPCYFMAAEQFADPALLPDVEIGAERWREWLEEGEEMHPAITSALKTLRDRTRRSNIEGNSGEASTK